MSSDKKYRVFPSTELRQTDSGATYVGIYSIVDTGGLRGEPVQVAGNFDNPDDALAAAVEAGDKVLQQL